MAVSIIETTRKLVNTWFLKHAHRLGFRTGEGRIDGAYSYCRVADENFVYRLQAVRFN